MIAVSGRLGRIGGLLRPLESDINRLFQFGGDELCKCGCTVRIRL
jgi:hypothetical protein